MRKDDLKVTLGSLIFLEVLSGYEQKQNNKDNICEDTNEFIQKDLELNNKAITSVANVINDKKIEV